MRKTTTLVLATLMAVVAFCQPGFAEVEYVTVYQNAVSNFYDVSATDMLKAVNAGITDEELPVVFFIASEAEVSASSVINARTGGDSWQTIAEANGLTATDFYVHTAEKPRAPKFKKAYAKYQGLCRADFVQVSLEDDEIVSLTNLRFISRHYGYSQHLIMTWSGEGKSFSEINHMVYAVTTEMRNHQLAETE